MPDFRVRFIGDLGNLASFNAAIRNQTAATASAIESQNARTLSRLLGTQVSTARSLTRSSGTAIRGGMIPQNVTTQIDAFNRSFRVTGELVRAFTREYQILERTVNGRRVKSVVPVLGTGQATPFDTGRTGNYDEYMRRYRAVSAIDADIARIEQAAVEKRIQTFDDYEAKIQKARVKAEAADQAYVGAVNARKAQQVVVSNAEAASKSAIAEADRAQAAYLAPFERIDKVIKPAFNKRLKALKASAAKSTQEYIDALAFRDLTLFGGGASYGAITPTNFGVGPKGKATSKGVRTYGNVPDDPWFTSRGLIPPTEEQREYLYRSKGIGSVGRTYPTLQELTDRARGVGTAGAARRAATTASGAPAGLDEQTRRNEADAAKTRADAARATLATERANLASAVSRENARKTARGMVATGVSQLEQQQAKAFGTDEGFFAKLRATSVMQALLGKRETALGFAEQAKLLAPPLTRETSAAFYQSPQLRARLEKEVGAAGIPRGSQAYLRAFQQRGVEVSSMSKDLGSNLIRLSGTMRDINGIQTSWNATLDKHGNLVEGFGRRWGAMSGVLRQTIYDFRKVFEWTVATTVVLGTFGAAVQTIKGVNQLNSELTRFAITSQTTGEETTQMFKQIAKVAYDTATPLAELVKAADDIALATRRAGQSAKEWQEDIISLSKAVGILTNLSGTSTVEATERLTAIFKQLGTEPENLIGVLNKVTAVAGGNAESINDITTALSLMTEAASQAQMTLDQQIAAVQVIAQATGKTADETATAFKNLFGAILNPISIKTLAEFGIAVKDSAGNMRPFLEIYQEIQTAIETGRIPQGRVQEVVRAIAGGPRRAPDAAALLSNIFKVYSTVATSINATNEALIANAKILDTNAAKWQQVQTLFDTRLFLLFNDTIKSLTNTLTDLAIAMASLASAIPPEAIQFFAQLGIFAVGGMLLGKAIRAIAGDLTLATARAGTFKGAMAEAINISRAGVGFNTGAMQGYGPGLMYLRGGTSSKYTPPPFSWYPALGPSGTWTPPYWGSNNAMGPINYGPAGPAPMSRLNALRLGRGGGFLYGGAALAGGLAAGAGFSAATGSPLGGIGGAMMVGGGLLSMYGPAAPIGLGLMGAGAVLSVAAGQESKKEENIKAERIALYESFQAWKSANTAVEDQIKLVDRLRMGIDNTKKGTEDHTAAVKSWSEELTRLGFIEDERNETWKEFIDLLNKANYGISENLVQAARAGKLTKEQRRQLTFQMGNAILKQSGSPYALESPDIPAFTYKGTGVNPYPSTPFESIKKLTGSGKETDQTLVEYLGDVTTNAKNLKELLYKPIMPLSRGESPLFQPNVYNVETISAALNQAVEAGTISREEFNTYIENFGNYVEEYGTYTSAVSAFVERGQAYAKAGIATGQLTDDEARNMNLRLNIMKMLSETVSEGGPEYRLKGDIDVGEQERRKIIDKLGGDLKGKVTFGMLKESYLAGPGAQKVPGTDMTLAEQLKSQGGDIGAGIDAWLSEYNLAWDEAKKAVVDWEETTENEMKKAAEAIDETITGITQSLGGEVLQAFADFKGGLISEKEFNQVQSKADDYIATLTDIGTAMKGLNEDALKLMAEGLSENVLGFEGVAASGDAVISRLLGIGQTLNLSGKQFEAYGQKVLKLAALYASLGKIMALVNAGVISMTEGKPLRRGGGGSYPGAATGASGEDFLTGYYKQIEAVYAEILAIQNQAPGTIDKGKAPKEKPLPGEIYLPEEVTKRGPDFVKSFVAQAVKDAAKIQSQVPGADKKYKDTLVAIFNGLQRVLLQRGIAEEYLTKAINENTEQLRLANETKADTINRIRIGYGSFAALANVPMNAKSGISVGGPQGPITISLNINGQVLTPAQWDQIIGKALSELKSAISAG